MIAYRGPRKINERVMTPRGPGEVSALYPPTSYYGDRLVQVTFDTADPETLYDSEGNVAMIDWTPGRDYERFRDDQLTPLEG